MTLLDEACEKEQAKGSRILPGDVARLHDTFGFPIELTVEIGGEKGMRVDMDAFGEAMKEQRLRARQDFHEKSSTAWGSIALPDQVRLLEPTRFDGYEQLDTEVPLRFILKLREDGQALAAADSADEGEEVYLVADATPFYAQGGGQRGDAGLAQQDGGEAGIITTERTGDGIVLHLARVTAGSLRTGLPIRSRLTPLKGKRQPGTHRHPFAPSSAPRNPGRTHHPEGILCLSGKASF